MLGQGGSENNGPYSSQIWRVITSFTATFSETPLTLEQREFLTNEPQEQRMKERKYNHKILEA